MQEKFVKHAPASGNPIEPEMNPADESPPGQSIPGDTVCPHCGGSGITDDTGMRCDHCSGTGKTGEGPMAP